jgi:CHAT domain-containing protein
VADAPVLGSADVDRLLAPQTCLLSFVVGESHAGVFVLGRSMPARYFTLPPPKELDAITQALRGAWSATDAPAARDAGSALSRALAPALAACPARARRLVISPDGALALLPFEMIDTGAGPLGRRYAVSYVQSFSIYGLLRQRPAAGGHAQQLLAVGAPTYAHSGRGSGANAADNAARTATLRSAVSELGRDGDAGRRAFDAMGMTWLPLPGAEREARTASGLFPRHRLLLGDEASEERLAELNRRGELARYRYLLFSTHGYLSLAHPTLSAIVLRQPGAAGYDGYLTAAELPLYELDSELIVLSACETGVGQVRSGSGVMGLPLALMIAGNRNAVVTLWRVPDASAAQFVVRLFRQLRAGQSPANAMALTKREMAGDQRYSSPLHWAGFVLYGAQ